MKQLSQLTEKAALPEKEQYSRHTGKTRKINMILYIIPHRWPNV
jgi:hypothetical protein